MSRYVNFKTGGFMLMAGVDPCTGQLRVKTKLTTRLLPNSAPLLAALLEETATFMKNFAGMLLHSANRIPSSALRKQLPEHALTDFFGPSGCFRLLAECREILALGNYKPHSQKGEGQQRESFPPHGGERTFL